LRVLLSSYQCLPDQGSELGNGWQWARALADQGHDVTVLTQPSHIIDAAAPPDLRFWHAAATEPSLPGRFRWVVHYLRWQEAALEYAQRRDPGQFDVVHHVSWGSLHLGCTLWKLPVPLVYGPIGGGQTAPGGYWRYFGREWPLEAARTGATRSLMPLNRLSRDTVRNAAVTLVTNSDTASACTRLGARDVRYMLAEGLPADWLVDGRVRPGGEPVVLWVGRFLPRKAPVLALEAFARLRRRVPARLVMAGDGPLSDQVRQTAQRLGVSEGVELLGRVPWAEIRSLYDSASAFLFTSLRDSSGSQFLEALGRGLPAVALDHHGVGDTDVGPAAIKVSVPQDPGELPTRLAAALERVLTDGRWDTRSAAAVAWAAGRTWPAKATEVTRTYADVTRAHPG
jgi:glycosyltransferase involved in cell wall biosynthesis